MINMTSFHLLIKYSFEIKTVHWYSSLIESEIIYSIIRTNTQYNEYLLIIIFSSMINKCLKTEGLLALFYKIETRINHQTKENKQYIFH